jgi:hypothetical protein
MNDDRLTEKLVSIVLGWKLAPGRFIKPDRGWSPRHRFVPCKSLDDAFQLVERVATACKLTMVKGGQFSAEVQVGARVGKAFGESMARTVTMALVSALELEVDS